MKQAPLIGAIALVLASITSGLSAQPLRPDSGFVVNLTRLEARDADVAQGQVLFSMPARYLRTGRLENEIRTPERPWAPVNSVAAGTPVFAQTFEDLGTLWCAVSDWRGNPRSICFAMRRDGSGRAYLGLPYVAPVLDPVWFSLEQPAQIMEDPTAEFPPMEMVYVLDRWSRNNVRLWRGLRVNGVVYRIARLTVTRAEDGSAGIILNGRTVRITQVGEDSARAVVVSE